MGSYSFENDNKINQQVQEPRYAISKSVSEASKMPSDESFQSQQYNIAKMQIKMKPKIGQISSLWERFQKQRRLKLLN